MTDKKRQLPDKIVDADGRPTLDFLKFMDDLLYGTGADSIGTLLSGQNTTSSQVTGLIAGTQPVADVLISGSGSLVEAQASQDANVLAIGGSGGGALYAYSSKSTVGGTRVGAGSVTSASVTITASGGTAPYTYSWAKKSGDAITATAASSATTAFNGTVGVGETITAVFTCTVTDSAGSPATFDVDVGVGLSETS